MNLKVPMFSFGLSFVSCFANAHPNKCHHTQNRDEIISVDAGAEATPHEAHLTKHNLILFGQDEIFASHIVFKKPHNFQLILKVNLNESARQHIALLRSMNPDAQVVFLLDPMDLNSIAQVTQLSGVIKERGSSNKIVSPIVTLSKKDFEIVYFDELPIDLSEAAH